MRSPPQSTPTRGRVSAVGLGVASVILAAVLVLGGCAGSEDRLNGTSPTALEPLSRTQAGGVVVGVVFESPRTLDEVRTIGSGLGGDLIALYGTDYACVRPITGGAPDWRPEPSRFAYVDAESIRERRIAAVDAGLSPPITGWLIAESYWLHWEDQWTKAQEPGVLFEAAAVYVLEATVDGLREDPRFRAVEVIPHRRTDSLDPSFPGELLLESEEFGEGLLSDPAPPDCGS